VDLLLASNLVRNECRIGSDTLMIDTFSKIFDDVKEIENAKNIQNTDKIA